MEEIYINVNYEKSENSTNPKGPTSSERRRHGAVVLSLSLLSVFLLAGLIGLCVLCHGSTAELLSLTEERDQLKSNLTEVTKCLYNQKKTCPSRWTIFNGTSYLRSTESGTWDKGREDCRGRGADLVVIESTEEQTFLTGLLPGPTWIGLTDKEEEGVWKWVDGTPLTLAFWNKNQPNNGGGDPALGEEDCAHMQKWNDRSCDLVLPWVCEKMAF